MIYYYVAEISHDGGKAYVKTAASNGETARSNIMAFEGCPPSAIELAEIPRALFSMGAKELFMKTLE